MRLAVIALLLLLGACEGSFFAVSDREGRFIIQGLPPGIYTLAAWHERFGEQTMGVAVGVRESAVVNFTFEDSK